MATILVVDAFETVLSLVYIPALVVLFLVTLYYVSPLIGQIYFSNLSKTGINSKFEAFLYVLFALFWLGMVVLQLAL